MPASRRARFQPTGTVYAGLTARESDRAEYLHHVLVRLTLRSFRVQLTPDDGRRFDAYTAELDALDARSPLPFLHAHA